MCIRDRLTPSVYAAIEARAARLESGLRLPDASVARIGSLLTVFFRPRPPRNFADAKEADTAAFAHFFHAMLGRGVVLPPSQFEAWFVSAAHDETVIDATLEALAR